MVSSEGALQQRKRAVETICQEHGLVFMYWQNNHDHFVVDETTYENQIRELKDKMGFISPYLIKEVEENRKKIKNRALDLERTTPKPMKIVEVDVPTTEAEKYIVPVKKLGITQVTHQKRKRFLGISIGKRSYTESVPYYYTENEERWKDVPVTKKVKKEVETPYPFQHFLDIAKKEILLEIRKKYASQERK